MAYLKSFLTKKRPLPVSANKKSRVKSPAFSVCYHHFWVSQEVDPEDLSFCHPSSYHPLSLQKPVRLGWTKSPKPALERARLELMQNTFSYSITSQTSI